MARNSFIVSYSFVGTDALLKQLHGVNLRDQEAVLVEALQDAAKPIVEAARANVASMVLPDSDPEEIVRSVRTGALRKSLGYVVRRYPQRGKLIAYIGARHIEYAANVGFTRSAKMTKNRSLRAGESKVVPARYAHLVEFGFRHRSGKQVPARPFLRNAFQSKMFEAEARLREGFAKALRTIFIRRSDSLGRKLLKRAA